MLGATLVRLELTVPLLRLLLLELLLPDTEEVERLELVLDEPTADDLCEVEVRLLLTADDEDLFVLLERNEEERPLLELADEDLLVI